MSAQRARSAVSADQRSVHPDSPGVPWWGAVLIAATATAIGFAFDAGSGSRELSLVFAASYFIGCLAAVLAVRQTSIFTAVVQPPLLLFVAVPTAYFLFHAGQLSGLKDTLINCGYPLIERFPLMFFTSAAVLLIGIARWYYGMSTRRGTPRAARKDTTAARLMTAAGAKVSSLLTRKPHEDDAGVTPRRRRATERPRRATTTAAGGRSGKPARRAAPPRPRHARPPETENIEPVKPRRARNPRQPEPSAEPRRRPRTSSTPRRSAPPPTERRSPYERPERRRRFDDYQPLEPHGSNGNGTHHPISRVRYRGAENSDDRVDYRPRRPSPRVREAERWEYDV